MARRSDGILAVMTIHSTDSTWYVASVGNWHRPHRSGSAATRAEAWIAALAAGRAALLAGELDDLAVAVNDAVPLAHYHPARDGDGRARSVRRDSGPRRHLPKPDLGGHRSEDRRFATAGDTTTLVDRRQLLAATAILGVAPYPLPEACKPSRPRP